jgi:hypothetical protein
LSINEIVTENMKNELDMIHNDIKKTLQVTRDGQDVEIYRLKSKKLILNGLSLSNKYGILKCIFLNQDEYEHYLNRFCKLLMNEVELVEKNLSPLLMGFYESIVLFVFQFNRSRLQPKNVLEMIERSSFLSYVISISENLQQKNHTNEPSITEADNSIVSTITAYFMAPEVWKNISSDIFSLSFQRSRILQLLRKIVLILIVNDNNDKICDITNVLSFDHFIDAFNVYFQQQKCLWKVSLQNNENGDDKYSNNFTINDINPVAQHAASFLQFLIPIVESEKYVSSERTESFLLELVQFFLIDVGDQPPFELKMDAFRLCGKILKSSRKLNSKDGSNCSKLAFDILKKRIFTYHFPGSSAAVKPGSKEERENCKAVEISLAVLKSGGIFSQDYFAMICRKILYPNHLLRARIDEVLVKTVIRYATHPAADMIVRIRSCILELSSSILFSNNVKLYNEELKEAVMEKICVPYLSYCQRNIIPKIFRTGYKSLPATQPLFDCLISFTDASKVGTISSSISKYSFSILQILYQRLHDKEIKDKLVKLTQGFNTGNSHLGKRFADGNEAALTIHVILQSKKIIVHNDASIDHSCKIAAFLCLCQCVITTQSSMPKQANLIFTNKSKKDDKTLLHWQNLIVDEAYPSAAWISSNKQCADAICHMFDFFWNQNKDPEPGFDAWAAYDETENTWVSIEGQPQPIFMKTLLDIGTNVNETPLYLKIFIIHLISQRPGYFKVYSKQWERWCISTLAEYATDARLFDKDFQLFFKLMTAILADWQITNIGDMMMKANMAKNEIDLSFASTLNNFFNNWVKVLAYTKGVIKSNALDHFEMIYAYWFHKMNSQTIQSFSSGSSSTNNGSLLSIDILLIYDIYKVGCNEVCESSHWLFQSMENSKKQNYSRWPTQLQALGLALYCIVNKHLHWNWERFSSVVSKDDFLNGIINKVFESKHVDLRRCASTFLSTLSKAKQKGTALDDAFYKKIQTKLRMKFNHHNKAETKSLLHIAVHLGPDLCNSRDFFNTMLGSLSLLDAESTGLALELTLNMLKWENAPADIVNLCFEYLKPSFDSLACQNDIRTQKLLLDIIKFWIETKPIDAWPQTAFVSVTKVEDSSNPIFKNTNFTKSYIGNDNPQTCKLFYQLCITMDRGLVGKYPTAAIGVKPREQNKNNLYLRGILLIGLKTQLKEVKECLFAYWNEILPNQTAVDRALSLLKPNIIENGMEDSWCQLSSYLMLVLVKNHVDYLHNSPLPRCGKPLYKCDFTDFKMSARKSSGLEMTQSMYMEPAFSSIVSSVIVPSSNPNSSGMDVDDNWASQSLQNASSSSSDYHVSDMVLATQNENEALFSLTQSTVNNSSNANALQIASQNYDGMVFRKRKWNTTNDSFAVPYFGNKRRKRLGGISDGQRNARLLYRNYRIGELPDTQLKFKDLIDPLLSLITFDKKLANKVANEVFLYALEGQKHDPIFKILARSNSNTTTRDFSFIKSCFTLLTRPVNTIFNPKQIEIIKHEALTTLNLAAGIHVIEENIICNGDVKNENNGWDCLNSIYKTLKEDEIMHGLKKYESAALNKFNMNNNGEVDVTSSLLEIPHNQSQDFFLKQYFQKLTNKEWKGAHGIVWEEIDKLLGRYSNLDTFSFSARHDALSLLPLYISCQDFVTLREHECGGFENFERLINTWEKSWPSYKYDSVKTWEYLHETRIKCLNTLPESNERGRAKMSSLYRLAEGLFLQNHKNAADLRIKEAKSIRDTNKLPKVFDDGYTTARYFYRMANEAPALVAAKNILVQLEGSNLLADESKHTKTKFYLLRGNIYAKLRNVLLNQPLAKVGHYIENARDAYKKAGGSPGYCALALFDEILLDHLENSRNRNSRSTIDDSSSTTEHEHDKNYENKFKEYSTNFIDNILQAMKCGSIVASDRFSRVLTLMANPVSGIYISSYFKEQASKYQVEAWKFLNFIPLIMAFLQDNIMKTSLKDIIINVATKYPQAVYYDFRIAKESLNLPDNDIELVVPLVRIFQNIRNLIPFANSIVEIAERKSAIDPKWTGNARNNVTGKMYKSKEYHKLYKGSKMPIESSYLINLLHSNIEIPGQYRNMKNMPLPNSHATIASVDESMFILGSMRAPKRLKFYGSDSVEYMFLAKSGEDLRNDQRVQQVFEAMNSIFRSKPACGKCNMKINTFSVVPITMKAGLIEWVDGTCQLNEVYGPDKNINKDAYSDLQTVSRFLKNIGTVINSVGYGKIYRDASSSRGATKITDSYQKMTSNFNNGRFRQYLRRVASTAETFLTLRSKMISSRAVINVAVYLLGVSSFFSPKSIK